MGAIRRCGLVVALVVAGLGIAMSLVGQTTWWAGYSVANCPGCVPSLDWSAEAAGGGAAATAAASTYRRDGVVVLPSVLSSKVPPGVEMMYHTAGEGYKKAVADAA